MQAYDSLLCCMMWRTPGHFCIQYLNKFYALVGKVDVRAWCSTDNMLCSKVTFAHVLLLHV
jgi:hypothetical protein